MVARRYRPPQRSSGPPLRDLFLGDVEVEVVALLKQVRDDRLPGHTGGTGIQITDQHERLGRPGDGIGVIGIGRDFAAIPIAHLIPLGLAEERGSSDQVSVQHQHRAGNTLAGVLQGKPGLTNGRRIGPVTQNCCVLAVE